MPGDNTERRANPRAVHQHQIDSAFADQKSIISHLHPLLIAEETTLEHSHVKAGSVYDITVQVSVVGRRILPLPIHRPKLPTHWSQHQHAILSLRLANTAPTVNRLYHIFVSAETRRLLRGYCAGYGYLECALTFVLTNISVVSTFKCRIMVGKC